MGVEFEIAGIAFSIDRAWIVEIYTLSFVTTVVMCLLEAFTWNSEWQKRIQNKEIWDKYLEAWRVNMFHYLVLGPAAYGFGTWFILRYPPTWPLWISAPGLFLTQAVGYALVHNWMHNPKYYAATHKYHHTFNEKTFVRPVTANSTTCSEFGVAYIAPILTGLIVFRPTYETVWALTSVISVTNLFIHTDIEAVPMGWLPNWLVTNKKHFHHHTKDVRAHYSAPILDLDGILGLASKKK